MFSFFQNWFERQVVQGLGVTIEIKAISQADHAIHLLSSVSINTYNSKHIHINVCIFSTYLQILVHVSKIWILFCTPCSITWFMNFSIIITESLDVCITKILQTYSKYEWLICCLHSDKLNITLNKLRLWTRHFKSILCYKLHITFKIDLLPYDIFYKAEGIPSNLEARNSTKYYHFFKKTSNTIN